MKNKNWNKWRNIKEITSGLPQIVAGSQFIVNSSGVNSSSVNHVTKWE